jgi:hypothetical protein
VPPFALVLLLCTTVMRAALAAKTADGEAAGFLTFESVLDGKCHILSEGGKLVLLRNTHQTRAIAYRLERRFVGLPQGLIDGTIKPGTEPQRLGCDTVGGRPQDWRVERAKFATEKTE